MMPPHTLARTFDLIYIKEMVHEPCCVAAPGPHVGP